MNELQSWAQGNIGAMSFLMSLLISSNDQNLSIIASLEQLTLIRGDSIYILWSDICKKDLDKMSKLLRNCPEDVLRNASSRQDRSGIDLVAQYLFENE